MEIEREREERQRPIFAKERSPPNITEVEGRGRKREDAPRGDAMYHPDTPERFTNRCGKRRVV